MTDPQNDPKSNKSTKPTTKPRVDNAKQVPSDAEIQAQRDKIDKKVAEMPAEYGGRPKDKGLEPTRYDDWEMKGRCIDF